MDTTTPTTTPQIPLEEFNSLLSTSSFLFIVVYRGNWCPFCRAWISNLQSLLPSITAAGGKTLILTAEPSSFLPLTLSKTSYTGPAINDPSNSIVNMFREKGWVDIAITEKNGYEHGMAQPGVLVLKKETGKEGVKVLESWAIVPSTMNLGGAKDRPELEQVWENVKAGMEGKGKVHKEYRKTGVIGVIWGKIFG